MGLKDVVEDESYPWESNTPGQICPRCDSTNVEEHKYYWRCNEAESECEVLSFIPTDYELQHDWNRKLEQ